MKILRRVNRRSDYKSCKQSNAKSTPPQGTKRKRGTRKSRHENGEAVNDPKTSPYDDIQLRNKITRKAKRLKQFIEVPEEYKPEPHSDWVSAPLSEKVAGHKIGGMVYVGKAPYITDNSISARVGCYIDPSLKVARSSSIFNDGYRDRYGYSCFSPGKRADYLDWLAKSRSKHVYNPEFANLYIKGLERRYLLEKSLADSKDIYAKLHELRQIYIDSHHTLKDIEILLDIMNIIELDPEDIQPVLHKRSYDGRISNTYAIGWRILRHRTITADWFLSLFINQSESQYRFGSMVYIDEFQQLFRIRFKEKYPVGWRAPEEDYLNGAVYYTYKSLTGDFTIYIRPDLDGHDIPSVFCNDHIRDIWDEISLQIKKELYNFNRLLSDNTEKSDRIRALALLPAELLDGLNYDEVMHFKKWALGIASRNESYPIADLIKKIQGKSLKTISRQQASAAADFMARMGIGIAPDPRFDLRSPKSHESVKFYDLGYCGALPEEFSKAYGAALLKAALGAFVAHADGVLTESERKFLLSTENYAHDLNPREKQRLMANIYWMLETPPEIQLLRKHLKECDPDEIALCRSMLIASAHADGEVQAEEVLCIEKLYKTMKIDPEQLYQDLHAGHAINGPVHVRSAIDGYPGEEIPAIKQSVGHNLDQKRIAEIQADTHQVSSVLGEIFEDDLNRPHGENGGSLMIAGLDSKHADLVKKIVIKDFWTEDEFQELCGHLGLMSSGAVEGLNEWAIEAYEDVLLEEYNGYEVTPHIAEAIKLKFDAETVNDRA
ncbi:MAG: TerB N-terminal domain-containing protein [Roseovarius sp.]|nr:TerB N-terminal domain-containing protein [Roseovarius sp.]